MKLTLDRMCITTNDLCLTCSKKIKTGEAGQLDIEIGKVIIHAAKQNKELNSITLNKIIVTRKGAYLIINPGDKAKFEKSGAVLMNTLSDAVGNDVFLIEMPTKVSKLVEDLISPVEPVRTSTVFIPPFGEKEIKVQIKKEDKPNLPMTQDVLSSITKELFGMNAHYAYV